MTTLRLYLTEHWPEDPSCDWAVIGPDGRPASEGRSEPRHWPTAHACEVVLAGAQCLWLAAKLPRAPRREQDRLVRFALEEHLVQEPDSQHFTITDRDEEGARVLVVARERLQQIAAQLTALGRPPLHAYAELQTIAPAQEGWLLTLGSRHAVISGAAATPFSLDVDADLAPPTGLIATVALARHQNRLPAQIVVRCAHDAPKIDLAAWSEALALPCERGEDYRWAAFSGASNLLQGEFSPSQNKGRILRRIRPALWLAGGMLALEMVFSVGQIFWQNHQISQARKAMQGIFLSSFPNQPVVNATAQFRSQLSQIRHAHGQLGDDDMLSLLAVVGETLGGDARDALEGFRYEDGRLELTVSPRTAATLPALIDRLRARGLQVGKLADNKIALRRDIAQ